MSGSTSGFDGDDFADDDFEANSHFHPGDLLKALVKPPISREQLKAYAEASGDFNEIHLRDEVAEKAGLPSVIAHGMLSMAFMGEFVESHVDGEGRIISLNCRFKAMVFPGDVITVQGTVKSNADDLLTLSLETRNQKSEVTATGSAVVALRG